MKAQDYGFTVVSFSSLFFSFKNAIDFVHKITIHDAYTLITRGRNSGEVILKFSL